MFQEVEVEREERGKGGKVRFGKVVSRKERERGCLGESLLGEKERLRDGEIKIGIGRPFQIHMYQANHQQREVFGHYGGNFYCRDAVFI